jgi:hypothetical protein
MQSNLTSRPPSRRVPSTRLLGLALAFILLGVIGGSAMFVRGISGSSNDLRSAYVLIGYGIVSYTISAVAGTLILNISGRLPSPLAKPLAGVPRLTWIVGGVGLLLAVGMMAFAITMGKGTTNY